MFGPPVRRRWALLALALIVSSLPVLSSGAGATDSTSTQRFAGASSAETAVDVSEFLFPAGAPAAVLARSDGSGPAEYAAGVAAETGGPVLLATEDDVPDVTMTELARLGAETVFLMGERSIFGTAVQNELEAAGYAVRRVGSALEAAQLVAGSDALDRAYLVVEGSSVDQIAAGAAAAAADAVVLEVPAGTLPGGVASFLSAHGVREVVMLGAAGDGDDARSLYDALEAGGFSPVSLFGRTPAETTVALEETAFSSRSTAVLANPSSTGEALVASGLGASLSAPLLYVDTAPPLEDFVAGALSAYANEIATLLVVGDGASVGDDVVAAAVEASRPVEVLPSEDVEAGMVGTGWTVIKGIDPEPFTVEVIDVLKDAIAPGIPVILIEASGPVIEETGGIAFGFSGSPVYVEVEGERKLIGAVAYGCAFCRQTIGGVTPADAMLDVLSYPSATALSAPPTVEGSSESSGDVELRRLDIPLGLGGISADRFRQAVERAPRGRFPLGRFHVFGGGRLEFAPFDPLFPGHSYAGVLSEGAFHLTGTGTTTYRDGARSLAFGHPFFWQGRSALGLSSAKVSTVIPDDSDVFGGFKVTSLTGRHGIIDQDRLAAVAGTEGVFPRRILLPVDATNLDTAMSFSFLSETVPFEYFPYVAAINTLIALDRANDRIGPGTSTLDWVIEGRRADGTPFTLVRGDRFASEWDITIESIWDLYRELYILQENAFEEISFDEVSVDATLDDEVHRQRVVRVEARSDSSGGWVSGNRTLVARPGDDIRIRASLKEFRGETVTSRMTLRVPRRVDGSGALQVVGGSSFYERLGGAGSFEELLDRLASQLRNDQLIANLYVRRSEGPEPLSHSRGKPAAQVVQQHEEVLFGSKFLEVRIRRR